MRIDDTDAADAPGQDSFLDIVANMVGIMILLVMVVGLRASREASSLMEIPVTETAADPAPADGEQVRAALHHVTDIQRDLHTLMQRTVGVHGETRLRERERNWLSTYVTVVEQELEDQRRQLDDQQQRDFDLRRKLTDAQLELDQLAREQVSLFTQSDEVEEIENLPTPLAKTVSGKEVHLRLAEGHVAYIPLDDLLAEFQQHAERNIWRLREQDKFMDTVGPVGGFRLRYRLKKVSYSIQTGEHSHASGAYLEQSWELLPTSTRVGEPTEQALLPRSDLWYALKAHPPDMTTVTIWTYPDSFAEFRRLKESLFAAGYATAGRPLPDGEPIGGSPRGTKSAAQ